MEVLDHDHRGTGSRDLLQEPSPGGERLHLLRRLSGGLQSDQRGETVLDPSAGVWVWIGKRLIELRRDRSLIVGFQDPRVRLHDLAERPEADPVSVGQTSALTPGDKLGELVNVAGKLADQARLAETWLRDDGDELRRWPRSGPFE